MSSTQYSLQLFINYLFWRWGYIWLHPDCLFLNRTFRKCLGIHGPSIHILVNIARMTRKQNREASFKWRKSYREKKTVHTKLRNEQMFFTALRMSKHVPIENIRDRLRSEYDTETSSAGSSPWDDRAGPVRRWCRPPANRWLQVGRKDSGPFRTSKSSTCNQF